MRNTAKQLLLEVLLLKEKYTEADFNKVIQVLQKNDVYLEKIIESVMLIDIERSKNKKEDLADGLLNDKLINIELSEPERFRMINNIKVILKSIESKTVKEIQKFISTRTTVPSNKKSRNALINVYLLHLCDLKEDELSNELELIDEFKSNKSNEVDAFLRMANKISEIKKS